MNNKLILFSVNCKILILFLVVYFPAFISISSQDFLKRRNNFQLVNWKFHKGGIHEAVSTSPVSGKAWEDVVIPHTWNAEDVLTKGFECYQGIGWYRSEFRIPGYNNRLRYFIRFEGVCLVADVYINGIYLGRHKGGYSAFCFEITSYLNGEETNVIAVKADNTLQPDVAPSGTHLYPLFGGIYRPVTIFSAGELCVSPLDYASSGVYISNIKVSEKEAIIGVETLLDYQCTNTL